MENEGFESLVDITLHEIFHVLGFSNTDLKYFHDPLTGKRY